MKERHHLVPIGLMGFDIAENVITIDSKLHAHIHQVMNIPFRSYSKLIRSYRRRFNGRKTIEHDQVEAMLSMQLRFLNEYPRLCASAKGMYVQGMNNLVHWLRHQKGHKHTFQPRWGGIVVEYQQALYRYYL